MGIPDHQAPPLPRFPDPRIIESTLSSDNMGKGLRSKSKKRFRTLRRCVEVSTARMHARKRLHVHSGRPLTRPRACAAARPACREQVTLAPSLIEEENKKAAAMQLIIDAPRPAVEGEEGGAAGPSGMEQDGAEEMDERPE